MKTFYLALLVLLCCSPAWAKPRIVTLAPHLTEWMYSLELESQLVGVSAFSDYPEAAKALPVVADYQGVDFTALMALEPDLILAWGGGNKPQDIARLQSLGFDVFVSQPHTLKDIASEITAVAAKLGRSEQARILTGQYLAQLANIESLYAHSQPITVFYYLWQQPLMTIGAGAWANQALSLCRAEHIFNDSPIDYPQVTLRQVINRQPALLIAASDQPQQVLQSFWASHDALIKAPLIQADANALHRFSLRIVPAISELCERIDAVRSRDVE
ncbi:cobalamin-binding protein [Alteromonas sp. AMM-1]|uniref:cobalamin-binding protein n=1 Tax=Alteromonas sp. AMM-1 TaxID=3394233 RepID=UPI0039A6D258